MGNAIFRKTATGKELIRNLRYKTALSSMLAKAVKWHEGGEVGTIDLDFESGDLSDYFDSFDADRYGVSNVTYSGSHSLRAVQTEYPGGNETYAIKTFSDPIFVSKIEIYIFFNFTGDNDDFSFDMFDSSDNRITNVIFKREYVVNNKTWLNYSAETGNIDCGVMPSYKWLKFTWSNINYSSKSFSFNIYNLTDDISIFSTDTSFFSMLAKSVKKIQFGAASYFEPGYVYDIDRVILHLRNPQKRVNL